MLALSFWTLWRKYLKLYGMLHANPHLMETISDERILDSISQDHFLALRFA